MPRTLSKIKMPREVSFHVSKRDRELVTAIVERWARHVKGTDKLSLAMDLEATHANGCRMDFTRLLGADDFNFAHDVSGIMRHINRTTGQLENCFLPRCHAAPRPKRKRPSSYDRIGNPIVAMNRLLDAMVTKAGAE